MDFDSPLSILLLCLAGALVFAARLYLGRRIVQRLPATLYLAIGALAASLVLAIAFLLPTEARDPRRTSRDMALGFVVAAAVIGLSIAIYRLKTMTEAEREALIRGPSGAPKPTDES